MAKRHDEQLYGFKTLDELFPVIDVVDNLTTPIANRPLSAKQGKILKELIDNIKTLRFEIVDTLPSPGKNGIIYLLPSENPKDGIDYYEEWVWIETRGRYELIGSLGKIEVDDAFSTQSESPVQNKVITEAILKLNAKVFPLSIVATGGGIFEKGIAKNITIRWEIKEGNVKVKPSTLYFDGHQIDINTEYKQFNNVTYDTVYVITAMRNNIEANAKVSVKFVNPSYCSVVDANFIPTENSIKALGKTIKDTKKFTFTGNLVNNKICYAYPKLFGELSSIKDNNNFEYIDSYTCTELTINNELYYIYILKYSTTIEYLSQIYN